VDAQWVPPNLDEEFNRSELIAPRDWARRAGGFLISSGLGERLPTVVQRAGTSRFALRDVQQEELHVDDDLKARLVAYLRRDLETLRQWMDPSFDAWGLLDR
jgi:hypothetical protein